MLMLARVSDRSLRLLRRFLPSVVCLLISGCPRLGSAPPQEKPLPQDPLVQVYFNHNRAASYSEPYRDLTRNGDDLETIIAEAIAEAQSSVEVAVQELRLPRIAEALVERHAAGVRVRVILENSYSRPWSDLTDAEVAQLDDRDRDRYQEFFHLADRDASGNLSAEEISTGDALIILRQGGVPTIDDTADGSKGSGLMHHKFAIVDDRTTIVTSANFTTSGIHGDFLSSSSRGNANNLLKIDSPELANLFLEEFNLMWGDGPGGQPDSQFGVQKPFRSLREVQVGETSLAVQFAPTGARIPQAQSVNGAIANALNSATQSVDMALFVFSEQDLANRLEGRYQMGVKIRALIDSSFAYRSYSEGLDLLGVALMDRNCRYEAGNKPWLHAIASVGVPKLPASDRLHHKFAVIDGKVAIAGSHNWSAAANHQNDETLVIVRNPTVAAHFQREFDRLYADAELGVPRRLEAKIQQQLQQCPTPAPATASTPSATPQRSHSSIASSAPSSATSDKVNVNRATQQELEALPGVGPTLAARIIKARQQQPFTSLEDLDRVPGIGPKVLERLRDRVTF